MEDGWRSLGSPKVITACPACYSQFKQYLPDMQVENLWTLLDHIGLPEGTRGIPKKLALHDSCTTRLESKMQNSIRNLLEKLGYSKEELPLNRENTVCCGHGGLMVFANKEVAGKVINRRIHENSADYVVYCSMCRDNFVSQGKRVYHIFDLMFDSVENDCANLPGPGFSERQENKARLKTLLLQEIWGEMVTREPDIKLIISQDVLHKMEDRMILVSDIKQVITHAESTGQKMQPVDSTSFIAYFQPANVTYWVEYQPAEDEGFIVRNAYCHRITIMPDIGGKQ